MRGKDRFCDYTVRWVYHLGGGPWALRQITNDVFKSLLGRRDVFWSLNRYPLDVLDDDRFDHLSADAVRPLAFDIDGHGGQARWSDLVKGVDKLVGWLQRTLRIQAEDVLIYFSGRGFHVLVPAEVYQDVPRAGLAGEHELVAAHASRYLNLVGYVWERDVGGQHFKREQSLLDMSLYQERKLLRVPGTINSRARFIRGGAQKVRLDASAIAAMAKRRPQEVPILLRTAVAGGTAPWLSYEEWA